MYRLEQYKNIIDLTIRPREPLILSEREKDGICDEMLSVLLEERNEIAAFSYPYKVKRDLIWGYLNQRLPNPVSARFLESRINCSGRKRWKTASSTLRTFPAATGSRCGRAISPV